MNVILSIAVAVLFYLHFSSASASDPDSDPLSDKQKTEDLAKNIKVSDAQGSAIIVYVNIDTLFEKYKYYKDVSVEVENNLAAIEGNFKNKVMKYQEDFQTYIDKAGQGLIPKEQAEQIEGDLMKRKTAIENEEKNIGALQEQQSKKLEKVQKKLYEFFKAFTASNNYSCVLTYTSRGEGALGIKDELDVTNKVLDALNSEYESTKTPPKK